MAVGFGIPVDLEANAVAASQEYFGLGFLGGSLPESRMIPTRGGVGLYY